MSEKERWTFVFSLILKTKPKQDCLCSKKYKSGNDNGNIKHAIVVLTSFAGSNW